LVTCLEIVGEEGGCKMRSVIYGGDASCECGNVARLHVVGDGNVLRSCVRGASGGPCGW
jgi:hypothetical protein